ncbi:MAG: phosphoglycerate dehydrogenase [Bacillota bacterium]
MSVDRKNRIFATSSEFGKHSRDIIDAFLRPLGMVLDRHTYPGPMTEAELLSLAQGYRAIIVYTSTDALNARVVEGLGDLEIIARHGIGYDNIDVQAASRRGIYVTTTHEGAFEERAVSDLAMALVLALARQIVALSRGTRVGKWERPLAHDLYGSTLGIVGVGRIGKLTALKARAFGMRLLGFDPAEDREFARKSGLAYVPLDTLLEESDFVTLHCPLSSTTRHLIGHRELGLMKPTAYLINCARGAVVDEDALYQSLAGGRLAGAGLDVFAKEPPVGSPLLELDNVVLTPHVGAYTPATMTGMDMLVVKACADVLSGKRPANLIN